MPPTLLPLTETTPDGRLRFHFHLGQLRAWDSPKRFVLCLAGWQSGKSVLGPPWLYREIQRKGPGDYLVASPSYPLMTKKVLPEFLRLFERQLKLGTYVGGSKNVFTFSEAGCLRAFGRVPDDMPHVYFAHAQDPESLESATYKAAWLDEAGQKKFRLASFEAILGRLSIAQGRVLLTTRPYDLGWLKQKLYDPWEKAGKSHPEIDVINFRSIDNPAFSREEYERARREMPAWKFRMNYDGLFTRPAGLIYDAFDSRMHRVPRFALPDHWPRYLGLDFGGVHTAGVFFAGELGGDRTPTGRLIAHREYLAGGRTAAEHSRALLTGEPGIPLAVGGSHSEGQWRDEFAAGGLPVREPAVRDVEVGIDRVYGAIKRGELLVFEDLDGLLDELQSYSRALNDMGEPTEEIEDKSSYHLLDGCRYLVSYVKGGAGPCEAAASRGGLVAAAPAGVFLD